MDIVFYDIETTMPPGDMIEFGAVVLDKTGLYEKQRYSTLIRSGEISKWSINCNGITDEMVKDAPVFEDVADEIFEIMNNKIWAGHNITAFDNPHLIRHFEQIGKPAPHALGTIDTLPLLRETFGKRAGNLSLGTLAEYFSLGEEKHRSMADCLLNIEILKRCCMTVLLEKPAGYEIDVCVETVRRLRNWEAESRGGQHKISMNVLRDLYPEASEQMLDAAVFHIFEEGIGAALGWLEAVCNLCQNPDKETKKRLKTRLYGATSHAIYHLYNILQLQACIPHVKEDINSWVKYLKEAIKEKDWDDVEEVAAELEEVLKGRLTPSDCC